MVWHAHTHAHMHAIWRRRCPAVQIFLRALSSLTPQVVLPSGALGWAKVNVMPHADPDREQARRMLFVCCCSKRGCASRNGLPGRWLKNPAAKLRMEPGDAPGVHVF